VTYSLVIVADDGGDFADFAPYVPSIDGRGRVAFTASLRSGGTGVFRAEGDAITELMRSGGVVRAITSHPDLAGGGASCAYAELDAGGGALLAGGATLSMARIGPLGPTMNEAGAIAFRADLTGIFRMDRGAITTIAAPGRFAAVHGLPVIDGSGRVVFRADRADGTQGIYAGGGGALTTLADTSSTFTSLSRFPCVNEAGVVAFAATRRDGSAGVFTISGGEPRSVLESGDRFESVRGALVGGAGDIVFLATPRGGTLGIHDGKSRRILALGDPLFGSTVVDFALNPVSINHAGQLAIRLALASGRQLVVRADP
jgi:hypothetical protein